MKNKKTISAFISALLIICLLVISGCSTNNSDPQKPMDKEFIQSMAKALESRWAMSTKDEDKGTEITVEMMNNYIQAELDELIPFESAVFEDTKLQEKAIKYINCLKESKEHIEYYNSDNFEELEKWQEIYNTRTVLIRDFVENYGLTVSDKYKDVLDEFITNGKSVEAQENKDKEIQKLVDSLEFKQTKNEYDWKTYQATLENTSNYDLKTLSIDVSLLDKEGTIIDTQYTSAENVAKGKKAILEFSTDKEFDKIELVLEYYETK